MLLGRRSFAGIFAWAGLISGCAAVTGKLPHPDIVGTWYVDYDIKPTLIYPTPLIIIIAEDGTIIARDTVLSGVKGKASGDHIKFTWKSHAQFEYGYANEYEFVFEGILNAGLKTQGKISGTASGPEYLAGACIDIIYTNGIPEHKRKPIQECPRIEASGTWQGAPY